MKLPCFSCFWSALRFCLFFFCLYSHVINTLEFVSGIRPHAVKKRTPRVLVASYDKDNSRKYFSPGRQGIKISTDANDGNVAHEIAFSLTEPSQRGGSPHVSRTPKKKAKGSTPSPIRNGERMVILLFEKKSVSAFLK